MLFALALTVVKHLIAGVMGEAIVYIKRECGIHLERLPLHQFESKWVIYSRKYWICP